MKTRKKKKKNKIEEEEITEYEEEQRHHCNNNLIIFSIRDSVRADCKARLHRSGQRTHDGTTGPLRTSWQVGQGQGRAARKCVGCTAQAAQARAKTKADSRWQPLAAVGSRWEIA